jgi:hypothetical protein
MLVSTAHENPTPARKPSIIPADSSTMANARLMMGDLLAENPAWIFRDLVELGDPSPSSELCAAGIKFGCESGPKGVDEWGKEDEITAHLLRV